MLTERTITAIAYEVGFGYFSHFNRAFRRRYGETPPDVPARWRGRAVADRAGRQH